MGKGSSKEVTQSSNQPPAQVLANYQDVYNRALSAASTPLQQYSGPIVAPFNSTQNSAFNTINNSQGISAPYIAQSANMYNSAASPISASDINQYLNPYQNDVIKSTMANINESNQQQQQGLRSNAISSGAWGGDRAGIAAANLARQQDLASNQTLAGLNQSNYNNALQMAQSNRQAGLVGASGIAGLGNEALDTTLQGANAQLQSGGMQQALAQQYLNVPYQQFLEQRAYPFDTTQYLANIALGIGNSSGSNGTTTQPGPSQFSQVAGLGLGIGSLFAMSDRRIKENLVKVGEYHGHNVYKFNFKGDPQTQFGVIAQEVEKKRPDLVGEHASGIKMVDYKNLRDGGIAAAIPEPRESYAVGGMMPWAQNQQPMGMGTSYHGVAPQPMADQTGNAMNMPFVGNPMNMMMNAMKMRQLRNANTRGPTPATPNSTPDNMPGAGQMDTPEFEQDHYGTGMIQAADMFENGMMRGGRICYPDGGTVDDNQPLNPMLDMTPEDVPLPPPVKDMSGGTGLAAENNAANQNIAPPVQADAPTGIAAAQQPNFFDRAAQGLAANDNAGWLGLAAAGFGMAAGRSPHAMVNMGEGGVRGLQAYAQTKQASQQADYQKNRVAIQNMEASNAAKKLEQEIAYQTGTLQHMTNMEAIDKRKADLEEKMGPEKLQLERDKLNQDQFAATTDQYGNPILYDKKSGKLQTMQSNAKYPGDVPTGAAGAPPGEATPESTLNGDDYLKTLPPQYAAHLKRLYEGREQFPTSFAIMGRKGMSPYWQKVVDDMSRVYGDDVDANTFKERAKAMNDFMANGAAGKQINALNTVYGHMGTLLDKIDGLDNLHKGTLGPLTTSANSFKNWYASKEGSPEIKEFNATKKAVADELTRVWRQSGGNQADIDEKLKDLDAAGTPEQLKGVVKTFSGLIGSKLDSFSNQWEKSMGKAADSAKNFSIISPEAASVRDRINGVKNAPPVAAIHKLQQEWHTNPALAKQFGEFYHVDPQDYIK